MTGCGDLGRNGAAPTGGAGDLTNTSGDATRGVELIRGGGNSTSGDGDPSTRGKGPSRSVTGPSSGSGSVTGGEEGILGHTRSIGEPYALM